MIHYFRFGIAVYLSGLALTLALMALASARDGDRAGHFDRSFLGFWALLWPVSLPIVLYLLATRRGPETGGRP